MPRRGQYSRAADTNSRRICSTRLDPVASSLKVQILAICAVALSWPHCLWLRRADGSLRACRTGVTSRIFEEAPRDEAWETLPWRGLPLRAGAYWLLAGREALRCLCSLKA